MKLHNSGGKNDYFLWRNSVLPSVGKGPPNKQTRTKNQPTQKTASEEEGKRDARRSYARRGPLPLIFVEEEVKKRLVKKKNDARTKMG